MVPIGRRLLLVSRASPESVLMRLGRNVTAKPMPGVPFSGRVYGSEFRIQPVWTWTPRGTSSPDAREAFGVPVCSVHGAVSAVGDGSQIHVTVRLLWPLPLVLLWSVAAYVLALWYRSFEGDVVRELPIALLFWGTCVYFIVAVVRGCLQEVRRITVAQPEPSGDPG